MCSGLHYAENIFKVYKEVGDNHKIDLDSTFCKEFKDDSSKISIDFHSMTDVSVI